MPASNPQLVRPLGLCLILLLGGCARLAELDFPSPAEGVVAGRIEHGVGGLSVVHLRSLDPQSARSRRALEMRVTIEQGHPQPRIAVLRPDQPFRIANRDPIYHEIFTVGPVERLRVRLASGQESAPLQLAEEGFVRGYCRLHPHESYAFLVTKADHILTVEGNATFEFPAVPVGEYRIGATGLDGESEETSVSVLADRPVSLTLRVEPRVAR